MERVDSLYECPICEKVLRNPKQCKNGHAFCELCIDRVLQSSSQQNSRCPTCNTHIRRSTLCPSSPLGAMIGEMSIRCVRHSPAIGLENERKRKNVFEGKESCQWRGLLSDLDDHIANECAFEPVSCPNKNCTTVIARRFFENHSQNECLYRVKSCQYCGVMTTAASLTTHHRMCLKMPVPCPNRCDMSDSI